MDAHRPSPYDYPAGSTQVKLMRYKAIIFDLDGTLIDSLDDIASSVNRVLSACGFPAHAPLAYREFIGEGVGQLIRRALPPSACADELLVARCLQQYAADYRTSWNIATRLYPGIPAALDDLSKAGLKLAILSNKPDEFTQACASLFLADWSFDVVMGASTRFPNKPDPASALEIARLLGLVPSEMLYLGDMPVDMHTARNSGMLAIGAAWGFRTRQQLLDSGANIVIDHPSELAAIARQL